MAATPDLRPHEAPSRGRLPLVDLAVLAVIALIYFYFVTRGTWWWVDGPRYYHELLGDAFLAGQLALQVPPSPELLALPDPYDPKNREGLRFLHDLSLYRGKYYGYWGPFPGVVHAAWQGITGFSLDQDIAQFVALVSAVVLFWWTLHRVRERYFSNAPGHLVPILTILFGVNAPMVYLAGRPIHYHESIIFGLTLVVLSWLPLVAALSSERHARAYLFLSGLLIACALLSRMPMVMYGVGTAAILAIRALLRRDLSLWREALKLFAFGAPVAVAVLILFAYNHLRFGSFSEFGVTYQLQGLQEYYDLIIREGRSPTRIGNIPPLLVLYLIAVPQIGPAPPYVYDVTLMPGSVHEMLGRGPIFVESPAISLFLITPVAIFALASPVLLLMRWRPELEPILTFTGSLFVGSVLTLLLICTTYGISLRYAADVLPALTMAASLTLHFVASRFPRSPATKRRGIGQAVASYMVAFTVLSIIPSVLLGMASGLLAWTLKPPPWG